MTYREIVDSVLADGFAEGKRASAKQWVQFRHAWLWDLEEWQFKFASAPITFTSGSPTASLGAVTDFAAAVAVYNSTGGQLKPIRDPREFFDLYNANLQNGNGVPAAYTVFGGQLFVGPNGDGSTGLLAYERSKPALVNDADTTGLPDGYDLALVHGGKAEGFKLSNVPLWSGFDDDFTAAANALRRNYLVSVRAQGEQLGSFTPGRWR
jgi:hypothetical protein